MAKLAVIFTPAAETDLDDIWFEIALDNESAADAFIDGIRSKSDQLSLFPRSGRARPDIGTGARSLVYGHYLILYRVSDDEVEIVRVVHGARELTGIV